MANQMLDRGKRAHHFVTHIAFPENHDRSNVMTMKQIIFMLVIQAPGRKRASQNFIVIRDPITLNEFFPHTAERASEEGCLRWIGVGGIRSICICELGFRVQCSSMVHCSTLIGIPLSRTEAVGTVTSRELKPHRFLKFTLDDGTGCVNCILWLNHFSSPSDAALIAAAAAAFADLVQLGKVARVRGQITSFRGALQITVSDVVIERDPNAEIFHWLDCLNLARKCYDVLPSPPSKPN